MRELIRILGAGIILAGLCLAPAWPVQAANLDRTADHVLGQLDFTHSGFNLNAASLVKAIGVAVNAQTSRVFVADTAHHRVLSWPNSQALTNGQAADLVIGQPNFITSTVNNGGLSAASLDSPSGLAVDAFGNLYVADGGNNRVLEYDAPLSNHADADRVLGQPDFFSGDANHGGLNVASLKDPSGLAFDSVGRLYVADTGNNRVLTFPALPVTHDSALRVFGQPNSMTNTVNTGGLNASGLNVPIGVALDAHDNLYVADNGNNRVLQYKTPLTGTTAADQVLGQPNLFTNTVNNGGLNASGLGAPGGLALDAAGNLYAADSFNNRVLEYSGPIFGHEAASRVFGQQDLTHNPINYSGLNADGLNTPNFVALDARGDLLVTDYGNNRMLEYDTPVAYIAPTLTGLSPELVAAKGQTFKLSVIGTGFVAGSTVRWQGGNRPTIYLSSTALEATIAAADIVAGGPFAVTVFTPSPGGGSSALINLPLYGRAAQDATADVVFGQPSFQAADANNPILPRGAERLFEPTLLAIDPRNGRLFVADVGNHRVLSWPNAQALVNTQPADLVIGQPDFYHTTLNFGGVSANSLAVPEGMAVDGQGNLYVADGFNNRVLVYAPPLTSGMAASQVFGQGGSFTTRFSNNGGLGPNSLAAPDGVAVDAQGNLYVADLHNFRILEYDRPLSLGTTADRVLGQPNLFTDTMGAGGVSAANLAGPNGIALDAGGNLYVVDYPNSRVLEYDQPLSHDAVADHVFGQPNFVSHTLNYSGLNAAGLGGPADVVVDAAGNVYVSDTGNHRVLVYDAPLTTDRVADHVIGQPNFITNTLNNGGVSALSLSQALGLALTTHGDLFVADLDNNRVLEYDRPLPLLHVFMPLIRR